MILASLPGCNPACRACHYKDLAYPEQLERKRAWAAEKLAAWSEVLRPIVPAPESERIEYRSKSWMRMEATGGRASFGFYRAVREGTRWGQEFISWDGCPIHAPALRESAARLGDALASQAPELLEGMLGIWMGVPDLVLILRKGSSTRGLADLPWSKVLCAPLELAWLYETTQVGRQVFQHREFRLLSGTRPDGPLPMRAFRQVARSLLQEARSRAVEALLAPQPEQVLDLYCGTGDLASLLPSGVGWIGIEQSLDAVQVANASLRSNREAFTGAVGDRLKDPALRPKISGSYSLYLNPPRSGLGEEGRTEILRLCGEKRPRAIAYLSCSASSLARDLRALESAGFRVTSLQPYDFFPQTEHFETLALIN